MAKRNKILLGALLCGVFQAGSLNAQRFQCVGQNDCGLQGAQPFLVKGEDYKFPESLSDNQKALTCNFGGKVIYAFDKLDIQADYQLEVVYLADQDRTQRIVVDGNELQGPTQLQAGKVQRYLIDLPKKAYAYGQLVLLFEVLKGPNAVVSELNLYSSNPKAAVPFTGQKKKDLARVQSYKVDTAVNVEEVLPVYALKPSQVAGVYKPTISLNGVWRFNERPASDFYRTKVQGDDWKSIMVPGEWVMQGFEVDSAAYAGYQTAFTLPKDWDGQLIKLRFDGVSSESVVFLNGKEVGSHLGGMTAFELDITKFVQPGENILSLKVRNESMANMLGSLTQYAAHPIGGITRKVTLMALPKVHVSDLRIETDFDSLYRDAQLKTYLTVKNDGNTPKKGVRLKMSVDGLPVSIEQTLPEIPAGASWSGWVTGQFASPQKWDNEHPHLYSLKMELRDGEQTLEVVEKRFGFREVQIDGNRLLVNGVPVKLRGVCRHEVHPLTGRVLTPELVRRDVQLYRDANCNFIRTSHYPPCEEFIEACDEMGMFVEVEAPICWIGHHGGGLDWGGTLNYRNPEYYTYVLQANMEMIHFYRNHPSVIFWSMANESYWNEHFAQVEVYVEKADRTRPHAFHDQAYGGFNNQGSTAPIANIHYPGPDGYKVAAKSERPMTYGEYCHLNVYNRSEVVTDPGVRSDWALALAPTWENMYKTPGVLGGSIWSGIDDIFQLPNGDAVGYGPWGPIDGWRRPKPEYWDMKKVYSPIRVTTKSLQPSANFTLSVENRYGFTDLNELRVHWQYGGQSGTSFVSCRPGESAQFSIPVSQSESAHTLHLSFVDPRGFVADEYAIPVGEQVQNRVNEPVQEKTRLKEKKNMYVVTGKDFVCEVSRSSGQILSMRKAGKEMICGGPWLMALPLTSGGCYPNHNANTPVFNDICSEWKVENTSAEKNGEDVVISVTGSYKEFKGSYQLHVNASGLMSVSYSFEALKDVDPRQWGLVFEAPRTFEKTFWRRDGLWTVYPQDHISRPVGEANLFYSGLPATMNPRVEPSWPWSYDFNELGSGDFRSTRRNIWYAGLRDQAKDEIVVPSNGKQHWRSWLEKDRIRFLVADFASPGAEIFLSSYYAPYRKPIKTGDTISGNIKVIVREASK